ncbi:3'-5' exoribonuclease [Vibrio parahaemolyticus]|nr:3'-5' exoribonuclease [Vibrio parahaemolyticus]
MLDLETMGSGSKAAIVSIGAVFFDPLTGDTGAEFYLVVSLNSSAHYGELDPSTVIWWMQQSEEARAVFKDESKTTLKAALESFSNWINEHCDLNDKDKPEAVVWGNGATFDNVIMGNAYKATRLRQPWAFYNDRDVRTIVDLGRELRGVDPKKDLELEGTAHNALDDAKFQVRYVSEIYKSLSN